MSKMLVEIDPSQWHRRRTVNEIRHFNIKKRTTSFICLHYHMSLFLCASHGKNLKKNGAPLCRMSFLSSYIDNIKMSLVKVPLFVDSLHFKGGGTFIMTDNESSDGNCFEH